MAQIKPFRNPIIPGFHPDPYLIITISSLLLLVLPRPRAMTCAPDPHPASSSTGHTTSSRPRSSTPPASPSTPAKTSSTGLKSATSSPGPRSSPSRNAPSDPGPKIAVASGPPRSGFTMTRSMSVRRACSQIGTLRTTHAGKMYVFGQVDT
ncbi:hypothetical protein FRC06_011646 [Ceratobasidium sp. 370]|nr:hypothetical protein FRC06_011646 [Ceratobasidium sp. 370]